MTTKTYTVNELLRMGDQEVFSRAKATFYAHPSTTVVHLEEGAALGPDYLDEAKERWNRSATRQGWPLASSADFDSKSPRRIVLSNVKGELGAYTVDAQGELALDRGER
jgi:hypothetical protein